MRDMARPHEFFDHTADIGVTVYGSTLADLFRNAALAMYEAMGRFTKAESGKRRTLDLRAPALEDLLHDWLAELLYEVETNHILYDEIGIDPLTPDHLTAILRGGPIDFSRSQATEEIKAVTYHQLRVEQLPDATWRATVIFDV